MSDDLRHELVIAMSSEHLRGMAQRLNADEETRGEKLAVALRNELTKRRARRAVIGLGPK